MLRLYTVTDKRMALYGRILTHERRTDTVKISRYLPRHYDLCLCHTADGKGYWIRTNNLKLWSDERDSNPHCPA